MRGICCLCQEGAGGGHRDREERLNAEVYEGQGVMVCAGGGSSWAGRASDIERKFVRFSNSQLNSLFCSTSCTKQMCNPPCVNHPKTVKMRCSKGLECTCSIPPPPLAKLIVGAVGLQLAAAGLQLATTRQAATSCNYLVFECSGSFHD